MKITGHEEITNKVLYLHGIKYITQDSDYLKTRQRSNPGNTCHDTTYK